MTFHILQNERIGPGLRRIAREQIDIVLTQVADRDVPQQRQVHSLRARCKKMRGLLRLPRGLMGDAFEVEDQKFRAAAKHLAGYRDLDVMNGTIESLGGSPDKCDAAREPVPAAAIERSITIMSSCRDAVGEWPLVIGGFDDLAPGLSETYQKCLDAWGVARREPSDAHFHELRKVTKYHWYQIRILEYANKAEIRSRRGKLRHLQLTLGSAHDLAMLQGYLESRESLDTKVLQKAISRKRELYAEAQSIARDVYTIPAYDLVRDFSRWWAQWRETD